MSLSKNVIETLIDLVEIKLSCIEVYDREDSREVAALERCRQELGILRDPAVAANGAHAALANGTKRRARRAA